MKTKVVFLQCMILSAVVFGQNEMQKPLPEIEVIPPKFSAAETFWNGKKIESIDDYLKANVEYPEKALNDGYYGTEVIQFVVTPTGELAEFKVINSVCRDIDEEVVRVLKTTNGSWKPALVNSEPVPMAKEVSLVFVLNESDDFVSMAKSYSK
ncbi:MAG: energy transducer TonB, partial [Bacteroidota bacterium]|nr:energy transducer TonB [Bacteroidota bacterium]